VLDHDQPVTAEFAPGDALIVATETFGIGDVRTVLWESAALTEVAPSHAPERWVRAIAFSADGSRAAAALLDPNAPGDGGDDHLVLWNPREPGRETLLTDRIRAVGACAFSPDGRRLAAASGDGTVTIWEASAETLVLRGHRRDVVACAFSPDGTRLVSASKDQTLRVWDAVSGSCLATLAGHGDAVVACRFAGSGSRVLSGSADGSLRLWEVERQAEIARLREEGWADTRGRDGRRGAIAGCAISPDGTQALAAFDAETLRLWNLEHGAVVHEYVADTGITAFDWAGSRVVAGTVAGAVIFLTLHQS
jgi:WD40 repeat protein